MMPDLSTLKTERAALAGKLAGIMEGAERLRFAEREETRLLLEIGRLGEAEVAAMREWAAAGALVEAPKIDVVARTKLAGELAQAQLQDEAARGAGLGLDEEQRSVSVELRLVNAEIDRVALDQLAELHAADMTILVAFVRDHVTPKVAQVMAFHAFLVDRGQEHVSAGRTDLGTDILRRAEVIGRRVPHLDAEPTTGDVIAKKARWSTRFTELTSDAPAGNVVALKPSEAA